MRVALSLQNMKQAICSECRSENISLLCKWNVKEQAWLPVEPPTWDHCGKKVSLHFVDGDRVRLLEELKNKGYIL